MPPDPFPWDSNRRGGDFRRQQHDRSGSDPRGFGSSGDHRWRENCRDDYYRHHLPMPHARPLSSYYHQPHQRWYSDFRSSRPFPHDYPGHDKQGSLRMHPDDAGDGFSPFVSRYGDKNLEDGYCRPFGSRNGDGRYLRNNRDNNRGSFAHKEWRTPSWEPAASSSGPGRPNSETNDQRSTAKTRTLQVNNKNTDANASQSDAVTHSSQSGSVVTEHLDKNSSGAAMDGQDISTQKPEKKDALVSTDWKPLKWCRSGGLGSRGSGLSQENTDMVRRPCAVDAAACATSTSSARSDDDDSRKKPRLGWGEGLAKYEKKKVEGPEDGSINNGLNVSVSGSETLQSPSVSVPGKSPTVANFSDCASPTTTSSVAGSSSPGVVNKEVKKATSDQDMANFSCSPGLVSQTFFDGPVFTLENLELASISSLSSLVDELLLQCDIQSNARTGYVGLSSINKLMVWKADILKGLEITESDIDSLEIELKSLGSEICDRLYAVDSPLQPECPVKACEESGSASHFTTKPASLQIDTVHENEASLQSVFVGSKNEDFDSPSSATSKFVEMLPSGADIFLSGATECAQDQVRDNPKSFNLGVKCLKSGLDDEETASVVGNSALHVINECEKLGRSDFLHLDDMELIYDTVFSSNKISAGKAEEELNKLLPDNQHLLDVTALNLSSTWVSLMVKDKFLMKKRFFRFKEKVLAIKFRVFQHFWNQGRVVKIHGAKAHKSYDLSISGSKKNRSSGRFRILSPENPEIVPAYEVAEYVKNFLLRPVRPCRTTLKMPALLLDNETKMSRFISTNGLVEDPRAVEKERSIINPWTSEEKEIFFSKFSAVGKNFRVIASFLDHKTTADCIEFYYKNHKSDYFGKSRKKPGSSKQRKSQSTTYMVASGNKWNRELNTASLDILGSASAIAATSNDGLKIQNSVSRCISSADNSYKTLRNDGLSKRSRSPDWYNYERETVAADVLARIGGSFSSEPVSYCNTSSLDPVDRSLVCRSHRFGVSMRHSLTPEVDDDDSECSDESCGEVDSSDWTDEEKSMFVHALSSYGKDFTMISQHMRSRSEDQCKLFFSKARKSLGLDLIQPRSQNCADVNGSGGGDSDDAIDMEMQSTISNDFSRLDKDLPHSEVKLNHESEPAGGRNLAVYSKVYEEKIEPGPLDSMAAATVVDRSNMNIIEENLERVVVCSETGVKKERNSISPGCLGEDNYKASAEVSDGFGKGTVNDKTTEYGEADSNCGISGLKSAPTLFGNGSHSSEEVHSCMRVDETSVLKIDKSKKKSGGPSLQQNDHLESMKSLTLFSVPVKYQVFNYDVLCAVGANGSRDSQEMVSRGSNSQQQLPSCSFSDSVDSSLMLKDYPVSVQIVKEDLKRGVSSKSIAPLENIPKRDGRFRYDHHSEFFLRKCNGSTQPSKTVKATNKSPELSSNDTCRPYADKQPSSNSDVKLFGKILASSSKPKGEASARSGTAHPKPDGQSLNPNQKVVNSDSSSKSKLDRDNSESIPYQSSGFWDTNCMQMGYPPLPDSSLFLAKYPAVFGAFNPVQPQLNYGTSTLNNGISVLSSKEVISSSNGYFQQHSFIDVQQQRKDGFNLLSGTIQQARGVVNSGGVSDPVASIKMHYANQMESIDDGAWRINGDVRR